MQIGGIGNSGLNNHGSASHRVTTCLHEHQEKSPQQGAMRISPASSDSVKMTGESQQLSLLDILRDTLAKGKSFMRWLWGPESGGDAVIGSREILDGTRTQQAGADPVVTLHEDAQHDSHVAVASTMVQQPQTQMGNNPYFTTHSDPGKVKENLFQKIRVKFRDAAGQLAKRFGGRLGERLAGRFSGKNSLDSRRQRSKEDLRRHSRYKDEDMEIDCVLTDDSYLMDSYDRKGEYSKLTTEKRW